MSRWMRFVLLVVWCLASCGRSRANVDPSVVQTVAELRAIKGGVTVTTTTGASRTPYPRDRLVVGSRIAVAAGGLAWLRRDGGATWLVSGPAECSVGDTSLGLSSGRAFVDNQTGDPVVVETSAGDVELAAARASVQVEDEQTEVYVLRGTARAGDAERAGPGQQLTLRKGSPAQRTSVVAWEDWTGGLGTADPSAEPAPFGIGTIGARKPGEDGKPRFSLVIERLDVRVRVDRDFVTTEVDQTFVNPSSDTVEGLFSFRTPPGAVLSQFGVDRHGEVVWGRVKESAEAVRQYESNVYEGSDEDPALLQWAGAGVYNARLYPIRPGAKRRVVTRYGEWLSRQGPKGERRVYVYPMAAEGAKASLPRIEELTVDVDLRAAGAKFVRSGMGGTFEGKRVLVNAFDFVPRADLAIELFDEGQEGTIAYRAPHRLLADEVPEDAATDYARDVSRQEHDYIAVPLRAPAADAAQVSGVDLAIVVDASAATEPSALAISRVMAASLLTHLGPEDRAALWTGDSSLRPVTPDSGALQVIDPEKRKAWLAGLAGVECGGATDLGTLLTEAAARLDPARRAAVIYIGDGAPSVGELAPEALRERLSRLPKTARVLAAAVGSQPNLALLETTVVGGRVEQVSDAYGAARASLRLLQAAGRPMWMGSEVDLGPGIERVLPRQLPPIFADETLIVVGRVTGKTPQTLRLAGSGGSFEGPVSTRRLEDHGDLRRRWGQQRLDELIREGAGRASVVDIGRRFGLISPVTSWYVPTERETAAEAEEQPHRSWFAELGKEGRWQPWRKGSTLHAEVAASNADDNREGGTGTRAKAEEGGQGQPPASPRRYAVRGPKDNTGLDADESPARELQAAPTTMDPLSQGIETQEEAQLSDSKPEPKPSSAAHSPSSGGAKSRARAPAPPPTLSRLDLGSGAGGRGEGIGLGSIGTLGGGFGAGYGRLGGTHRGSAPSIRMGQVIVGDGLPKEIVQRIVRQNFGRFRLCYEGALSRSPGVQGHVQIRFGINADGRVVDAHAGAWSLREAHAIDCIVQAFYALTFPRPERSPLSVAYSLTLAPGDLATTPQVGEPGALAAVGHERLPCGPGADLPLAERMVLWRERLRGATRVETSLAVYLGALRDCEAGSFRERAVLLIQIVDRLPQIRDRVQLWRALLSVSPLAADAVYRFILLRVKSSQDLRELHDALGLERIDPELLAKLLARAKDASQRLALLRGAAEKFPDDVELALTVLDAYEDAGDAAGGRAWARKLRRRTDATSHVRTTVGEYYFRLSARGQRGQAERDADEGRRTFGEIVEFAPEDPLARRRLGDLLRAHGYHDAALRQYQTLQVLTPDDPSVSLLLAAAAQGLGKTEEAVRWAERAGQAGAPDGAGAVSLASRALASAFLAWSRLDSTKAGKPEEVTRLRNRAARLAGSDVGQGARVILTWSHPELRATLWTNALGAMMPASENLPLLGVAQAYVPTANKPVMELRLEPRDAAVAARLGVTARLTLIEREGADDERIVVREVNFVGAGGKPVEARSFEYDGSQLEAVAL